MHVTLHPRLPLFLVYVEKIGEPGDEATVCVHEGSEGFIIPQPIQNLGETMPMPAWDRLYICEWLSHLSAKS